MSTASLHCGTACGPRAGGINASSVPGGTGMTRGHYDPRAERQLGSPSDWTEPKCGPDTVRAAFGASASTPTLPPGLRELRLRHSPPSFLSRAPPELPP